ncbi:MAG: hypothetical protein WBE72_04390 [Terracidiphilus sp.]
MSKQTISDYKRLFKTLAVFVCLMPLGGWLTHHEIIAFFPPLGDSELNGLALTLSTVLAGAAAILPWRLDISKRRNPIVFSGFGLAVGSGISYFCLCQLYVVSVPLPNGQTITVSIGSIRSQLAQDNFASSATNERLVQEQANEDGVQKLWTRESILRVRLLLFLTYLGWLLPLNFILGLYARSDHKAPAGKPRM